MATKPTKTNTDTVEPKSTKTPSKAAAVAAAARVNPQVVTEDVPDITAPDLKNKELVDEAVTRSGIKRRDAKPSIEAAMAVLGDALAQGREVNLPGFGKVKVKRMKTNGARRILELRMRQNIDSGNAAARDAKDGVAEPDE
jgi:nucleoid DNA-binding protein